MLLNQESRFRQIISYGILAFYSLIILFPLYIILLASLKKSSEIYKGPMGLPETFQWNNYVQAWAKGHIGSYFTNSVLVTVVSVVLIIVCGALAAYAISKTDFKWSKAIYALFLIGMMIPIQVYMVPLYVVVARLGLLNSYNGMILSYIALYLSFSIFIITAFFRTIPKEIVEAANIDGCNGVQMLGRIYVPLALPAFATVGIYCAVHVWNDMLLPLLFVRSKEFMTIPMGLISFKGEYVSEYSLLFAGVIISAIPMVAAYISFQKMFIKGITAGAVKG